VSGSLTYLSQVILSFSWYVIRDLTFVKEVGHDWHRSEIANLFNQLVNSVQVLGQILVFFSFFYRYAF
jgi:hypothetical protein